MSNPSAASQDQSQKQQSESAVSEQPQKPVALEEDDEFEDFPVEDWPQEEAESGNTADHLWEESWDDDDTNEDFSKQLKEELKKVEAAKRS
ncbi:hypothetical protein AJ80_06050 [Polytolypa hystricis UAMH7299]|uniref:26S proteasome complex subunit SEM1 n=1 Tax=Polytolypa hystricis (strain UAMH7299) TaxID=1447883 RepID=A0A2B7XZH6_POLH7|nr:hypothetical protein AJ80_06050 [Polytolypa hystricis UAMH7299]